MRIRCQLTIVTSARPSCLEQHKLVDEDRLNVALCSLLLAQSQIYLFVKVKSLLNFLAVCLIEQSNFYFWVNIYILDMYIFYYSVCTFCKTNNVNVKFSAQTVTPKNYMQFRSWNTDSTGSTDCKSLTKFLTLRLYWKYNYNIKKT